jgi:DNA helicase-2/ATP-dependent DNA helicase PcrA
MAGMEDGLFPHSRSLLSEAAMEEERRLCYVGMTRAEKRLVLSWARSRRRFGGGEQERTIGSRFLKEIPSELVMQMGVDEDDVPQVDLTAERWQVQRDAKRNLYTGKTYNSVENVAQFFKERGVNVPVRPGVSPVARSGAQTGAGQSAQPPRPPAATPVKPSPQGGLFGAMPPAAAKTTLPKAPSAPKQPPRTGTVVEHPKYGTGTIVRREGDGEDAKIIVVFQRYGIKKLVEKYAGLKKG